MPDLDVRLLQTETGKVWQGTTGKYGEVYFKVPNGMEYRIDAGDEENITTFREPKDTYLQDAIYYNPHAKGIQRDRPERQYFPGSLTRANAYSRASVDARQHPRPR